MQANTNVSALEAVQAFRKAAKEQYENYSKNPPIVLDAKESLQRDLALGALLNISRGCPTYENPIQYVRIFFPNFAKCFDAELAAIVKKLSDDIYHKAVHGPQSPGDFNNFNLYDSKGLGSPLSLMSQASQGSVVSEENAVLDWKALGITVISQVSSDLVVSSPAAESKVVAVDTKVEMARLASIQKEANYIVEQGVQLFKRARTRISDFLKVPENGNRNLNRQYVHINLLYAKINFLLSSENKPEEILELIRNPNPRPHASVAAQLAIIKKNDQDPWVQSLRPENFREFKRATPFVFEKEVNQDPDFQKFKASDQFKKQMAIIKSSLNVTNKTTLEDIKNKIQEKIQAIEELESYLSKGIAKDAEAFTDYLYGLYSIGKLKLQLALRMDPTNEAAKQYLSRLETAINTSLPVREESDSDLDLDPKAIPFLRSSAVVGTSLLQQNKPRGVQPEMKPNLRRYEYYKTIDECLYQYAAAYPRRFMKECYFPSYVDDDFKGRCCCPDAIDDRLKCDPDDPGFDEVICPGSYPPGECPSCCHRVTYTSLLITMGCCMVCCFPVMSVGVCCGNATYYSHVLQASAFLLGGIVDAINGSYDACSNISKEKMAPPEMIREPLPKTRKLRGSRQKAKSDHLNLPIGASQSGPQRIFISTSLSPRVDTQASSLDTSMADHKYGANQPMARPVLSPTMSRDNYNQPNISIISLLREPWIGSPVQVSTAINNRYGSVASRPPRPDNSHSQHLGNRAILK